MHFVETSLQDAFLIELDSNLDNRGSFCRLFCSKQFKNHGLSDHQFQQVNLSENRRKGTLRGMHFQAQPHLEAKIVFCLRGNVFDVIIDLRKSSPTYLQHSTFTLSGNSALYIPKGFAHGFLTLEDNCALLYLMSDLYQTGYDRGYRYDDPAFGIKWPFEPAVLSEKDQNYQPFEEIHALT